MSSEASGPSDLIHQVLPSTDSPSKPHTSSHDSHHSGPGGLLTIHHEGESGRSGIHFWSFMSILWRSSSQVSMAVNILWPFVPVAIILHYLPGHHSATLNKWVFATSYIGMVPAANLLGFAGQELARKMPKVAGILIETALGSIVEIVLFMILIAKHKNTEKGGDDSSAEEGNLIPVIQAAILGSILTNLLLCLGLCFFFGGIRRQTQTFHAVVSEVGSGLLLVAGFGLLIPSAFYSALKGETRPQSGFTEHKLQYDVLKMSQATSIILMIAFAVYIVFNARSQHSIFDEILEADEINDADRAHDMAKEKLTFSECVVAIVASLTFITLLAIFLVEQIETIVHSGVPDQFLGLILLPLVEKAAEHLTAVDEAWDGQMNFALYHCLGPSIQTALFNGPLVVIVGWALGKPMDLNFEIFMIALLVLSILVVGNFLRDKESNYLEGTLLVIVYLIIAIAAWYYPDPDVATSNEFDGSWIAAGIQPGATSTASLQFKAQGPRVF
ncbi:Ca2+:H+ antiporter [Cladophialophora psammophila CBS 110553]|uniref:Ca2+:H+ antiporter n=1 Tax=Cladophialophora psammophila CBS 110553 TaxID=1182543 RepID=W9WU60_9EURO|nr:Ca2+:H+ antiporter [Cladophialophora psammophila CBS 110553]EXJ71747.1 Ca2+:H+ antiporter [Cladophialophora psammophila CBS 110553]